MKYFKFLFLPLFVLLLIAIYFATRSNNEITLQWIKDHTSWHQKGANSAWAGFDKVYFVTLPERLENVRLVSEKLGIKDKAWIMQAFHKKDLDIPQLTEINFISPAFPDVVLPTNHGRIGCYLSHLAVMLDCFNDPNVETCVIFEDDLYIPRSEVTAQVTDFHQRLKKLDVRWDILYLDYCGEQGGGKTVQDIRWLTGCSCLTAYVIKKNTVSLLMPTLLPMHIAIDEAIRSLIKQNKIIALGPDKEVFFGQNRKEFDSVINPGFFNDQLELPRFRNQHPVPVLINPVE